uniref:Putative secreted protein n=1 Tax=Anopheles marajoara TaxID=58244 RepID=A0A2M4CAY9_9DIPT
MAFLGLLILASDIGQPEVPATPGDGSSRLSKNTKFLLSSTELDRSMVSSRASKMAQTIRNGGDPVRSQSLLHPHKSISPWCRF